MKPHVVMFQLSDTVLGPPVNGIDKHAYKTL